MNILELHDAAAAQADQQAGRLWLTHIGWTFGLAGLISFLIPMLMVDVALDEEAAIACGPWLFGAALIEVAAFWVARRSQHNAWWKAYVEAYSRLAGSD